MGRLPRTYYFDIETVPKIEYKSITGASFDPEKAKIITIQYQELHPVTGVSIGGLTILKEWEEGSSERAIVERFRSIYLPSYELDFVPVGNNLAFESKFMKHKLKEHCSLEHLKLGHKRLLDLKCTFVMMNKGDFEGYSACIGKCGRAENISPWYYNREWDQIEKYIRDEAEEFIHAYVLLKKELPQYQRQLLAKGDPAKRSKVVE